MPHEFVIGEVYVPPLLIAAILGTIAAVAMARLLNRFRLSRFFFQSATGVCRTGGHFHSPLRDCSDSILRSGEA